MHTVILSDTCVMTSLLTTVTLGLSDDDEGLEGLPNHATTETSSHLSPSDSSPLGKKAT